MYISWNGLDKQCKERI